MPVTTVTYPGAPDGMVRAVAQHEIPDSAAWTIVDALLNDPGLLRRRGALSALYSEASASAIGLAGTTAPDGTWVGLQLVRTAAFAGKIKGFKNSSMDEAWGNTPGISPYELFNAADALGGGCFIGSASELGQSPSQQSLVLYRGATKGTAPSTATSGSYSIGATSITLTSGGGANFCAGHFLFDTSTSTYIGVVKEVSGDILTLEHPALHGAADHVYAAPYRGINPRASKGRITCATDSTTVNGGETRFLDQNFDSGTWDLFTPDFTYIGTVSSVASNTQLTLAANAAVALLNSDYIAIKQSGSYGLTSSDVGFLTASHAHHQFYAKGTKVIYSDLLDPEALFIGPEDDDTFEVTSDPVSALISTTSGLVISSERETHVLSGAVGTTPDRWRADLLIDDGCICPMTAVQFRGGAIWAGRRGVWYWNGGDAKNVLGALGDSYHEFMAGFDLDSTRAYGMVHNDHYFLHVEAGATGVFAWYDENNTPNYLTRLTFVVNLKTGAVTILRNVGIRGALAPPASVGDGETYFSVTTDVGDAAVVKASDLFTATGNDTITCSGDSAGPAVFVETKKYDGNGDPQRLKRFKLLMLHYLLDGTVNDAASIAAGTADHIRFATVKGLNSDGTVSATKLFVKETPNNGDWQDKRGKFMQVSQFVALRFWEGTDTITNLVLSSWALGYKLKRPGQV